MPTYTPKRWEGEMIGITLLGNLHCNFECDHCCYMSGPHAPDKWMPESIIRKAMHMRDVIREQEVVVEWNIIGGEITLGGMDWLERTIQMVGEDWTPISIVTNGWWMSDVEAARRFFDIIRPYCPDDGIMSDFTVRISNDVHHDPFRPHYLQYDKNRRQDRLKTRLHSILSGFDEDGIFYEPYYYCSVCDVEWEYDEYPGERCPTCDDYVETDDREVCERIPLPHPGGPYIYVDDYDSEYHKVWPTGRAREFGALESSYCSIDDLVVRPDGQIWDYACKGCQLRFGTVDDNPFKLLDMVTAYVDEVKPTCKTCHKTAARWLKDKRTG